MSELLSPLPRELFQTMWARYGNAEDFVARMRATMAKHSITQAAVAAESGFHFANVSKWLGRPGEQRWKRRPDWKSMAVLDEALSRLLARKGVMPDAS